MIRKLWYAVAVAAALVACSVSNNVTQVRSEAANFAQEGNYSEAFNRWKTIIEHTKVESLSGSDFAEAAKVAFKAGNTELAKAWFDQARYKEYADEEMYRTLANIYHQEDNLSKELSALELLFNRYQKKDSELNTRLLAIYHEIGDTEKVLQVWKEMSDSTRQLAENRNYYFDINVKLGNEAVCDSLAQEILKNETKHAGALEWMAKKYYWAGQNRYNQAMATYNKKKTRKNYAILLQELDKVTADFKKALPYLNTLWELNPGEEYAGYFANIYARFGDEQKANYYKKFMKR